MCEKLLFTTMSVQKYSEKSYIEILLCTMHIITFLRTWFSTAFTKKSQRTN